MSFVLLEEVGQHVLVTQSHVVEEWDACNPVAVFRLSIALYVVLASGEVPHEVAPVHEITLVGDEEPDIVYL